MEVVVHSNIYGIFLLQEYGLWTLRILLDLALEEDEVPLMATCIIWVRYRVVDSGVTAVWLLSLQDLAMHVVAKAAIERY
jgi:hypothetical protein